MKGVMICEGEFEEVVEFPTKELFDTYRDGFVAGAGKYGCGSADVYTRDDLDELRRDDYHKKTVAIIEKHLPAG
jgi:hypothetical protein